VPNTSEINYQIYQHIKISGDARAWIGVYRDENEKFITTGSVGVSYTNWNTGEPSRRHGGNNEDCVEMNSFIDEPGQWNDLPCWRNRRHVCELVV
jgi:hypothetical protein